MPKILAAAAVATVALLAACHMAGQDAAPQTAGASQDPAHGSAPAVRQGPSQLRPVHDPGEVTGTLTGPCHFRSGGQLPDRRCTPGSYDPAVTQANIGSTICRRGYTGTVRPPRSQTGQFKHDEAYPAYGVPDVTSAELDHLVPLELGGSNDASNLWLESGPLPNPKDAVEAAAHAAVCNGRMTLETAQIAIAQNWILLGKRLGVS